MTEVYVGMGSNLGDRLAHLRRGLEWVAERYAVEGVSPVYETDPVGYFPQGLFYNAVVRLKVATPAAELLAFLLSVESRLGRVRRVPGGARRLDLDILFYGSEVMERPGVVIPHPRLHERAFVLVPLQELAPDFVHPVLGRTVREMTLKVGRNGVRRVESQWWAKPAVSEPAAGTE